MLVSIEKAQEEVTKWLDYKGVSTSKRDKFKDMTDALADAISDGILSLDADMYFVQKLKFPIDNDVKIAELKYKPRLDMKSVNAQMEKVKPGDFEAKIAAYAAALTLIPQAVIKSLDTEDYGVVQAIAFFFIPQT